MTPIEYRETLAELNLSQVGAARLCGVNPRTSRCWARVDQPTPIPESAARLLRLYKALLIADDSIRNHLRGEEIAAAMIQPHAVRAIRAALISMERPNL